MAPHFMRLHGKGLLDLGVEQWSLEGTGMDILGRPGGRELQ